MSKKNAKTEPVVAFKGFDPQLRCRGFQYRLGATYTHDGEVSACKEGFHACENPFDVLGYYPLLNDDAEPNRFAIVEQGGALDRHDGDSKIASATITIKAELTIPEFVERSVQWLIDYCSCGNSAKRNSEDGSNLAASGACSNLAASGVDSKLAASGAYSKLAASGAYSKLAASGVDSKLAASGACSKLAASGAYSNLAASGAYSNLAASGACSNLAASGACSNLAASGVDSKLAASGVDSVIASSAYNACAKGAAGTWIALAEFDSDGKCVGFATGRIGDDSLKPDTWYVARGGKLVTP